MQVPMSPLSVTIIDEILEQIASSSSRSGGEYLLGLPASVTGIDLTAAQELLGRHGKELEEKLGRELHPVVVLLDLLSSDGGTALATSIDDFCLLKKSSLRDLVNAALYDNLTGLYSRNILDARLREEFSRARRYDLPLSALFIDIDAFKSINDTYGHAEGDRVLAHIGRFIRDSLREVDFPVRYGGEEFVIVLPHTDGDTALSLAERIHTGLAEAQEKSDLKSSVTLSIGVGTLVEGMVSQAQIIDAADRAVYKAKEAGKNMVWPEVNAGPTEEAAPEKQQ